MSSEQTSSIYTFKYHLLCLRLSANECESKRICVCEFSHFNRKAKILSEWNIRAFHFLSILFAHSNIWFTFSRCATMSLVCQTPNFFFSLFSSLCFSLRSLYLNYRYKAKSNAFVAWQIVLCHEKVVERNRCGVSSLSISSNHIITMW